MPPRRPSWRGLRRLPTYDYRKARFVVLYKAAGVESTRADTEALRRALDSDLSANGSLTIAGSSVVIARLGDIILENLELLVHRRR